jgi:hypothetical protein
MSKYQNENEIISALKRTSNLLVSDESTFRFSLSKLDVSSKPQNLPKISIILSPFFKVVSSSFVAAVLVVGFYGYSYFRAPAATQSFAMETSELQSTINNELTLENSAHTELFAISTE